MFSSGDKPQLRLDPEPQSPGKLEKSHKPYNFMGQGESNYVFDALKSNRELSGRVKYVIRSGLELMYHEARDMHPLMTPDTTLITSKLLLDVIKSTAMFGNHLTSGDWSAVASETTLVHNAQAIRSKLPYIDLVRSEGSNL
ncbi:hypothetical protein N7471_013855 [Penicillium samsonianum]|uniref:uncharacterized protein n=1 Tax=Penicillium samsonianum TaxID=1882272 RepID=UPI002546B77C|nr:uncharacterized protein N7471_013855 [Penicillium samsonianum]KAJ6118388.1 hypothetical protein N7471_013855 [Penicillium samsonianum]